VDLPFDYYRTGCSVKSGIGVRCGADFTAILLREGFSFKINSNDDFREDLKIVDENNHPLVFIEVKGTNSGVKREYVNQADSHRERAGLDSTFPSILVVNTHIKNSKNIQEKDQPIPEDQINTTANLINRR
jgi:hypothetical protein